MHFAYPEYRFWCMAAGAAALLAFVALARKWLALRRLAALSVVRPLLLVRRGRQLLKAGLIAAVAGMLAIALLGPQWGQSAEEPQKGAPQGRDLLIVLDVSRSMLAEDVAPSRLERARADLRDLTAALKQKGGYRLGLIAFADRAALLCPITSDYRSFEEELAKVSLQTLRRRGEPHSGDGTQLGMALDRAGRSIHKELATYTDVLLISDGGDMEEDTLAAAEQLAKEGIVVHCVGMGDATRESPIPLDGPNGQRTWLTYQGQQVRTRLEEKVLREVAQRTGGQYVTAGTGFLELDRWYDSVAGGKQARELQESGMARIAIHRFQWFLLPALALLLLEMMVSDRRRPAGDGADKPRYFTWIGRRKAARAAAAHRNEALSAR